jgi:hypothetical protein
VRAAAQAEGQTISHSLVRMLTKLASHAGEAGTRRGLAADGALREHVTRLVGEWSLDDPNPAQYAAALEQMARTKEPAPARATEEDSSFPCEPARIVEMALEVDAIGAAVRRAALAMLADGALSTLLDLLECAPESTTAAAGIWEPIAAADPLRALLAQPQPDQRLVQRLVQRQGVLTLPALLDALAEATDPARREQLLTRIATLGPSAAPIVAQRLGVAGAPRARELLTVIARLTPSLPKPPPEVRAFLTHADPLTRREAVRLLLAYDETRDAALLAAVRDADARVLSVGLLEAQERASPRAAATIRQRLDRDEISDDIMRAAAVRAVCAAATPGRANDEMVDWLLVRVLRPARMLRGARIAAVSAELLAALSALATKWSDDRRVHPLLQLARLEADPSVRKAAGGDVTPTGNAGRSR